MDLTDIETLVAAHLDAWNAPEGRTRDAAVAAAYSADVFIGEPAHAARGHEAMGRAISGLQAQVPGTTITLAGPIQVAQDLVTYAWILGTPGQPPAASGRDVLLVRDGRIASLYVVIDAP